MDRIALKYGINPHQGNATLSIEAGALPLTVLNGTAGYINILDALLGWQLVSELKRATNLASAASFKHASPAGSAVAVSLKSTERAMFFIDEEYPLSEQATAFVRARGADRLSSFGDFIALSDRCDESTARLIALEVSDGIIAPGYEPEALEVLKQKRGGNYPILEIDPGYEPSAVERRQVFGFELYQERNAAAINPAALGTVVTEEKELPADVALTLAVATIALKYTQSNSVCVAYDGQVIGMGAGQQSRVHCTRLACGKADKWFCQQHPRVLALPFREGLGRVEKTNVVDQFLLWDELSDAEKDALRAALTEEPQPLTPEERAEWIARFEGVALSSDAFIPFRDTIDRAHRSGVRYVLQAGGSIRDDEVTAAADSYGMVMIHSGMRWFLH